MKYILFLLLLFISLVYVRSVHECPSVYDGLTNERLDLDTQISTSSLSANWSKLDEDDIVRYEYAIISSNKAHMFGEECRKLPGFIGRADVYPFTDNKKETSVTVSNLSLDVDMNYIFIVRTTFSDGRIFYSNSNGIKIEERKETIKRDIPLREEEESNQPSRFVERNHIEFDQDSCPIDADNRCRQSEISVRDRLNEIYGEPRFNDESQQAFLFYLPLTAADAANIGVGAGNAIEEGGIENAGADDDDSDDDDDDGAPEWIPAVIVAAVIILILLMLCCVLLILLLGILLGKGGEDRFNERIVERNVEDVDAEFGARTERTVESDTRVEFPDIDPHSRLSQL